ncbi:VOC family protein [Celerinatantimonas yamalensis]|uniref:VOC family protein n=1 Tax=Celerinatantimonas yamalensis TaxID=559956 RepID=A0ABW9G9R5_9GAMM
MNISQKKPLSLDHVLMTVHDYEVSFQNYKKLGFAPSPVSYHPWGTATSFMMFEDNFIELIGVKDASKFGTNAVNGFCFGRQMGKFLEQPEDGISLIALHSKDTRGDYPKLIQKHPYNQGIVDFRREIILDDGTPDEVVVTIGLLIDDDYPQSSGFICQQHRPDLIWVDEWRAHPNGATRIAAVTYGADDLSILKSRWDLDYGEKVVSTKSEVSVQTGSGELRAMTFPQVAKRYEQIDQPISHDRKPHPVALTIATKNLQALAAILETNQLPHQVCVDRILVSPTVTGNIIMEFIQER